jgi:CRISPR type I-E-associated protein CasB/Cse2
MATDKATKFVTFIAACAQQTGPRAALRSGLGRTVDQASRLHPYVAPWTLSERPHEEAVYYTVASLIAHAPDGAIPTTSPGNIGASIARIGGKRAPATQETYVHLLARQPASSLCRTLTRIIVPLRTDDKPVSVDFARLLDDASRWPWQHQRIGREWLQSYYRTVKNLDTDDTTVTDDTD